MTFRRLIPVVCALITVCMVVPAVQAQEVDSPNDNFVKDVSNAGTSAAAFLQIGVGARAMAMGNAGTTLAHDATALFWNPAAAANLRTQATFTFDHTDWLVDTNLDYVGMAFRVPGVGTIGLSVLAFDAVDNQPVRTILQPEGTGEFYSASDVMLGMTYATTLTDRFSAGITGKYIRETVWNETARALAVDLGILYRTRLEGFVLAASILNFGGNMQLEGRDLRRAFDDDPSNFSNNQLNVSFDTDKFSIPLTFRFGFGYEKKISDYHRVTLVADLTNPSDNSESVNLGFEYTFGNTLSLRGGYAALFERDRVSGLSFGVGVNRRLLGRIRVVAEYSYADMGYLGSAQRFTLGVGR
ncbi:MAG: PorV/PorQ family protein [Bacteroidetes bacterium]|nr:PorV/PorQ family protein [Bacteroidota bacterium]